MGGEEDVVVNSSGKRGRGIGRVSDSDKVGSKRSRAIAKSRRGKSSSDSKNSLKQNSGDWNLQAQGRG